MFDRCDKIINSNLTKPRKHTNIFKCWKELGSFDRGGNVLLQTEKGTDWYKCETHRKQVNGVHSGRDVPVATTEICNFGKRLFYKTFHVLNDSLATQMSSIGLFSWLVALYKKWSRHTNRQDDYCNPGACALRVNNICTMNYIPHTSFLLAVLEWSAHSDWTARVHQLRASWEEKTWAWGYREGHAHCIHTRAETDRGYGIRVCDTLTYAQLLDEQQWQPYKRIASMYPLMQACT